MATSSMDGFNRFPRNERDGSSDYFPCVANTSTTPDYTCLCEQYLWRLSCFDNHASNPLSHLDRATADIATTDFCRKAGSVGVERVKREHQRQKRQIGDFLSSIVGDVSSVLSSNGVTVPTAVIESVADSVVNALPTPANPTSIAAEITAAATEISSTATSANEEGSGTATSAQAESTEVSQTGNTAKSASLQEPVSSSSAAAAAASAAAASSSDSDSGPSAGLIAGVVVGAVAALALIGIFVLLLLRHRKKKKNQTTSFADKESSPKISSSEDQHPPANTAYQNVPQQNAYPTTTTIPTSTNAPTSRPATMLSPVSPITPGEQVPWPSSSNFAGGAGAAGAGVSAGAAVADTADHSPTTHLPRYSEDNRYSDEKPPQRHQFLDSKIPESNEMPTNANVWEIGGREIPHPSELEAGRRDGLNLGDTRLQQGQGYAAYRPPSIQDGQQDGEFMGNQPVGQAL
ncbi:hypothetical protein DDE82_007655 [Stemphylium lycopersici]|uniref:Uncharacterized protein n=1 Tax=Stemphylium lycopersici TaxID=183478 RepID=A0A364MV96_STELY|nr:hypothetical protein TW65_08487 [Stemphylium lycopersici]RAR00053.1 hypothetical protein DDE82_007655 [Stemphylium lycopersici]RAR04326.1 hypothetical protein DDE83_007862 [Stemphylium lycopersici]